MDSAAGGAKISRNSKNQAVLPLRGKVLNTCSKELADIIKNQEIKDILTCLGCGIGDNFNINNLRYERIIIMSDADPDGNHITNLLSTLFLFHLPQLIEAGKVYMAVSPLYKFQNKRETCYFYTEEEYKKNKNRSGEFKHIKGLGELNPKELYETTMNPENRKLIQLTTKNLEQSLELFDILMGKSSKNRRDFILKNNLSKYDTEDFETYDDYGDDFDE